MAKSRAVVVGAAALLAVTLGRSIASADPAGPDTLQWADGAGDMWSLESRDPAPTETEADIRAVSVTHGPQSLVVRARYHRLEGGNFMDPVRGVIRTPDGRERRVELSYDGDFAEVSVLDPDGKRIRCGPSGDLDLDRYVAVLEIPRSCVGEPRWVRVSLESQAWDHGGSGEIFADDGMGAGMPGSSNTFSARIYPEPPRAVASGL